MFISRVDLTLSKKLSAKTIPNCKICSTPYGLWHYNSESSIHETLFLCTKCLVNNVISYLQNLETAYHNELNKASYQKATLNFIKSNPILENYTIRAQNLICKSYSRTCHACSNKTKIFSYGVFYCWNCGINELIQRCERALSTTIAFYENIIQTHIFLKELQKELQNPEYSSELLE